MQLTDLRITDFRSIRHVALENAGHYNVLVGRNNSGKSSIFGALSVLQGVVTGRGINTNNILPAGDETASFEVELTLRAEEADRIRLLELLSGISEARVARLRDGPLARVARYRFRAAGANAPLRLEEASTIAEDGKWSVFQALRDPTATESNPESEISPIGALVTQDQSTVIDSELIQGSRSGQVARMGQDLARDRRVGDLEGRLVDWAKEWLASAFFLSPVRRSAPDMAAHETNELAPDGTNLAGVLHTIHSNDPEAFQAIERFVSAALPDIGQLVTPLTSNQTYLGFRATNSDWIVRLHDTGGGVEQLVVIATLLTTALRSTALFIEEPESHLHPGAQRFLLQRLISDARQVFLATHAATFVNAPDAVVYQVRMVDGRTHVARAADPAALAATLDDIGVRNSDVLLTDGVVFVEGPGDCDSLHAIADTLGVRFSEHNITVFAMGGGSDAAHQLPVRSQVLSAISDRSPVPHLFVIDRDERTDDEVTGLQTSLAGRLVVLERRELENYLFSGRAILAVLRRKYRDRSDVADRLSLANDDDLDALIREAASGLRSLTLLKRVRAAIGGLPGGALPREELVRIASLDDLAAISAEVLEVIDRRVQQSFAPNRMQEIVTELDRQLTAEWADAEYRLVIVPGEEVLEAVFRHFGGEYQKRTDTAAIARELRPGEIASELALLIERAAALA